mmetsp:Transcript_78134/g.201202  ORF Transcript_78134/g.201202 Transcript_78134/m.201202 type:complete len:209 (-) Transcript_78134:268-894(-)
MRSARSVMRLATKARQSISRRESPVRRMSPTLPRRPRCCLRLASFRRVASCARKTRRPARRHAMRTRRRARRTRRSGSRSATRGSRSGSRTSTSVMRRAVRTTRRVRRPRRRGPLRRIRSRPWPLTWRGSACRRCSWRRPWAPCSRPSLPRPRASSLQGAPHALACARACCRLMMRLRRSEATCMSGRRTRAFCSGARLIEAIVAAVG